MIEAKVEILDEKRGLRAALRIYGVEKRTRLLLRSLYAVSDMCPRGSDKPRVFAAPGQGGAQDPSGPVGVGVAQAALTDRPPPLGPVDRPSPDGNHGGGHPVPDGGSHPDKTETIEGSFQSAVRYDFQVAKGAILQFELESPDPKATLTVSNTTICCGDSMVVYVHEAGTLPFEVEGRKDQFYALMVTTWTQPPKLTSLGTAA